MITQDPFASLDPRMTIRQSVSEGVRIQHTVQQEWTAMTWWSAC